MENAVWIVPSEETGEICPVFRKTFAVKGKPDSALLEISAMGVYEARLNGERIGDFILAPGFTSYRTRLQYQTYDVTSLLREENILTVTVGNGWYCGRLGWFGKGAFWGKQRALIAELTIRTGGHTERISTDAGWMCGRSEVLRAELYDGEICDANIIPRFTIPAAVPGFSREMLIPQEGEKITEHERIVPQRIFRAPNGELLVDFGQNLAGYVEICTDAHKGDKVVFSHGEILDENGNFFNGNLRTALQRTEYICREGHQCYKPRFAFMGFRYLRIEKAPENTFFTAIAVYSDMKRTGRFCSGNSKVNQLYRNIIWGQKSNFLDIPTDCPQRDERLGWTGDAEVFIRTAALNYDVDRFFSKWLRDLSRDQLPNGAVTHVVPDILHFDAASHVVPDTPGDAAGSAGWGDAAVICPWQLYLTYGDTDILAEQFDSMQRWIAFSGNPHRFHFGDWLALDAPEGAVPDPGLSEFEQHRGRSSCLFISEAFHVYCLGLMVKICRILERDGSEYEAEYRAEIAAIRKKYTYHTQTEYVLAAAFGIAEDPQGTADRLADLIRKGGNRIRTGFVGTPYLLHVLSRYGHADTAYDLLLQEEHPSWLFEINHGATTVWEHWDSIHPDGTLSRSGMNSYNHYAYGSVADWLYGAAAGIRTDPAHPGFANVIFEPFADRRLGYVNASVETKYGTVSSSWRYDGDDILYSFTVPRDGEIHLAGKVWQVGKGNWNFIRKARDKNAYQRI